MESQVMDITTDTIKDIAVDCVTQFINNKQPLSEGLAKHASQMALNVDQIKRSIEATNQIGYLKLLGMNPDRTFEFPVARYEDVMKHMVLPTKPDDMGPDNTKGFDNSKIPGGDGDNDADDARCQFDLMLAEKQAMARKGVLCNHVSLGDLEIEKAAVLMEIGDLVKKVSKDEWIIEKLAEVATEDEFPKLVKLATGKDACNVDVRKHVFNDSELSQARTLSGLLKKAYDVVERESIAKKIDDTHYRQGTLYKSAAPIEAPRPPTMVGNTLASGAGLAGKGLGYAASGVGYVPATVTKNLTHRALSVAPIIGPKFKPEKPFRRLLPKSISKLDIAFAAATPVDPQKSVWNTLQGEGKRF